MIVEHENHDKDGWNENEEKDCDMLAEIRQVVVTIQFNTRMMKFTSPIPLYMDIMTLKKHFGA